MSVLALTTKNIFEVKGEKFVVIKKDYLDELAILMRSVMAGEKLLKGKKTRSFQNFVRSVKGKVF